MTRAFVTYSHLDIDFVTKIKNDVELSNIEVTIDHKILAPGDSVLKLLGEIGRVDFHIPILSSNSIESNWVRKELRVAFTREIEEPSSFRVIPIVKEGEDWEELKHRIPDDLRETLRDKFLARFDMMEYSVAIRQLINALSPTQQAEELYSKIQGLKSDNPFRRVRTEYFENLELLARSFAEPESVRYDRVAEVKPTVVEGGRGSGKTMILKSLKPVVNVYRSGKKTFAEAKLEYFGVYSRLSQGSFSTQESNILDHLHTEVASRIFSSELVLRLIQSLLEELQECIRSQIISITRQQEDSFCTSIIQQIIPARGSQNVNFEEAKREIRQQLGVINDYVSRKILKERIRYEGVFLRKDDLREVSSLLRAAIPELANTTIYFLLDEYENLLPFQKVVVNTLIKWSESKYFTIKLATKKATLQDPQTLEGQEVEESNDYNLVDLDYDLTQPNHRALYKNLIEKVCGKILTNEGFTITNIRDVLEDSKPFDGVEKSAVDREVGEMYRQLSGKELSSLDAEELDRYFNHVEVAATYRVLKSARKKFAGTDDFSSLSSGIMRYFLELCGMSYYFAIQKGRNVKGGDKITIDDQTDAAYMLSSYHLYMIRKNIANVGPTVQQFLVDVGDIFRFKLLKHLSEPEAARIAITDPQRLLERGMQELKLVMDAAVTHSVVHSLKGIGGIRPKNATDVQPTEYIPCRIYAPALRFSPRPRWRSLFTADELAGLIDPTRRADTKAKLISELTKSKKGMRSGQDKQQSLSEAS